MHTLSTVRTSDSPAPARFPCCSKENNLFKNVYQISFALKMHGQNLKMNILLQSRVADPGFMVGAGFVFWKRSGPETLRTFWIKISWNRFFYSISNPFVSWNKELISELYWLSNWKKRVKVDSDLSCFYEAGTRSTTLNLKVIHDVMVKK